MLTWEPDALKRGIYHGNINESRFSAVKPNTLQTFKQNEVNEGNFCTYRVHW